MTTTNKMSESEIATCATQIVSSFVGNNSVPMDKLPDLIRQVRQAIAGDVSQEKDRPPSVSTPTAAEIRKSIGPDYLISFENGKRYRFLKSHLGRLKLTPEQYREKWGLPDEYPMVAEKYSEKRSELAKQLGLGRKAESTTTKKAR